MLSVNQFVFNDSSNEYIHDASLNIPITDAPSDTDFTRWAMLYDGSDYCMYFFKGSTNNRIYQFVFNGYEYQYGYGGSYQELTLVDVPADADASSFAMLHDGSDYRLYLRQLGNPNQLYQFAWVSGTNTYKWGHDGSIPKIPVTGFPDNSDRNRWAMLHDGEYYRLYRMELGNNNKLYQGSFNDDSYEFGSSSIPELSLTGTPSNSDLSQAAMLYDGSYYRFYFLTKKV